MPQDVKHLVGPVKSSEWPHVRCPACLEGYLAPEFLETVSTAHSSRLQDQYRDEWEPDWIKGGFYGVLRCGIPSCGEPVIVSGDYTVGPDLDSSGRWYGEYADLLQLRFTQPPLSILITPPGTPAKVVAAVTGAAALVWADPGAASNRLRGAVEELLTSEGVRRFEIRNHKRNRLSTHNRILEYRRYESGIADILMAVKWIGNTGSHEGDITAGDVLEGAEILGHALRLRFDTTTEEMERRITRINKRKGIPKKRGAVTK
jgi:hypothetical protein